ncbi:DUF1868 domain-containing protein [Roseicitreum antarcticum]|uniref:DUF1868 domain-containing protein n=1 Tax=Roseicitreum antarcticum TaxID=564137 RepID=A0A1H2TNA5_9RHOB|nr:DUF1868 domain-containing protein [Roseicitreum antarcticum]SDW45361.1 hypothetical protein SAMN04488238_102115 [Roseicitreum antarcticum]
MNDTKTLARPDPVSYLTGRLETAPRPAGISLPGEGGKFASDGSVQHWPGNTFVRHVVQNSAAHDALRALQEEVKMSRFARFFTFLPPASFHMTVFQGMSPGFAPRGPRRDAVSGELLAGLDGITFPAETQARIAEVDCARSVTVTGAGDAAEAALRHARGVLRDATGINPPDFDTYAFHISLAYLVEWLTEPTARAVVDFSAGLTERYNAALSDIPLGPVEFCNFETMHHFEPLKRMS